MYPQEYRSLANAPWWKFWLHRRRSQAITTLLDHYLRARSELETERWVNGIEKKANTNVIEFLAKQIK